MYIKPDKNYRMSAQNKWFLAQVMDAHRRGELKRSIIQADLEAALKPKEPKNKNQGQPQNDE